MTRPPSAVTLVSTAPAAPAGRGSAANRQAEPLREVHTAGSRPAAPTATKPDRAAVTASTWLLPPGAPGRAAGAGSGARAHVPRPAEYHAAGTGAPRAGPPAAGTLPT